MLYKGKGAVSDANNYRGIALMPNALKILTKLLARRLQTAVGHLLPDGQYGFRYGRSTTDAITHLRDFVRDRLAAPRRFTYAGFVDFSKAFDKVERELLVKKMKEQFNIGGQVLEVICSILKDNKVALDDGLRRTADILQTIGVLQGDSLSPLLFVLFVGDLPDYVTRTAMASGHEVQVLMYADDAVILASTRESLQCCLVALETWCTENKMTVNTEKTKVMKFRRGGPLSKMDKFQINNKPLEIVPDFEYLGVTLQPTLAVTKHLDKIAAKCARATHAIPHIHLLSLDAAVRLFNIVIHPIATYAIKSLWQEMTTENLRQLDQIKSRYLKTALRVSKYSRNTKIHLLTNSEQLCQEVCRIYHLPETPAYYQRLAEIKDKEDNVELSFFTCPAMQQDTWKQANCTRRHLATRYAMHGFHHTICDAQCWEPSQLCKCRLCGEPAGRYHLLACSKRIH